MFNIDKNLTQFFVEASSASSKYVLTPASNQIEMPLRLRETLGRHNARKKRAFETLKIPLPEPTERPTAAPSNPNTPLSTAPRAPSNATRAPSNAAT